MKRLISSILAFNIFIAITALGMIFMLPSCRIINKYNPNPELQEYVPDEKTLDILLKEERACFDFFWNTANTDKDSPGYGLIPDRMPSGPGISSIASVGFGLTAICIGAERGWITREQAAERVLGTLNTLYNNVEQSHGFFYHFIDIKTGKRVWNCEVSIIDTALCLNGVIMAAEYFKESEISDLAEKIYARVDWPWYTDKAAGRYYLGYTPESGFFGSWDMTAEQMMMYFLGAGSQRHPVDPMMFYMFGRPRKSYGILPEMIHSPAGSLFVYQYTHAWYDFRNMKDALGVDWFRNSVIASLSSWQYAIDNARDYETNEFEWGFTACDGPDGYSGAYGSQPAWGNSNDGTIPPCGPAGSIVFTPENSAKALAYMYKQYPELWGEWGFRDAYNKLKNPMWIGIDVIGIDKGITMLMIENYLSGMVWNYMMQNRYVQSGMKRCRIFPANSFSVESFEDNYSLKGITGENCVFNIQSHEACTGVKALKINARKNGTLRFEINPKFLNDENNALLRFAAKGAGMVKVRYLTQEGRILKTFRCRLRGDAWNAYSLPAAQGLNSDINSVHYIEFVFPNGGNLYLDDVEFVNEKPRIYNVILYGSREAGSVLKPVWNTWDKKGRKIYIDEVRWYVADSPRDEWKRIEGENGLTYTLRQSDVDKFIKCELFGVIPEGYRLIRLEPAESEPTKRITAKIK